MGLGLRILIHEPRRLAASALGVGVAVVIMFAEMGFFFGVVDSQVNLARLVTGDLVVLHSARTNLTKWNRFPRLRLDQIAALEEVAGATPLYKSTMGLLNPATGQVKRIVAFAFPPARPPIATGAAPAALARLSESRTVLFDRRSRDIYGSFAPGDELWLDGTPYVMAGFADIGPTVIDDGAVVMSEGSWLARDPGAEPTMGVVHLRAGADAERVRARIVAALPGDVTVLTADELIEREIAFTTTAAPLGLLFGIGVLAGLVVGTMICYQVLFNEIVDHRPQYATLRAMGFADGFLGATVIEQAAALALAGFGIGLAAALGVYGYVQEATELIMRVTAERCLVVFALTLAMCVAAGLLAMRRVAAADPAELY